MDFDWDLDDLNEIVNFYFEIERKSEHCEECGQTGYNPETRQISEDWYDFEHTGRKWNHNITQDEVQALVDRDRLHDFTHTYEKSVGWQKREDGYIPTAEEVNAWSKEGFGHDSINHYVCVNQRAERLGVYGLCSSCEGEGYVYTEPAAKLGLVLWVIHPRKGCSRGIHIKDLKQENVIPAMKYLTEAMERNANRFSGIAGYVPEAD